MKDMGKVSHEFIKNCGLIIRTDQSTKQFHVFSMGCMLDLFVQWRPGRLHKYKVIKKIIARICLGMPM